MTDFKPLVYEWDHGLNRYVTPGDRVECLKERVVAADDYVTMKQELRAEVERLRAENVSLVADGNSFKDVIDRLWWLIREGEKHFGTLWRYATLADIEATRKSSAFPTTGQ